jgi:hypothetical protein
MERRLFLLNAARFMGLDEVRHLHAAQHELAAFRVADGKAGVEMTPGAGRDSY